jgi:hypothetical protein
MRRIGEGDLSPLGVRYDRHHEGVRQFVARATSSNAHTEDITHETFLTLAKSAGRSAGPESASLLKLAEEKGFEPLVPLRARRFSKPLPSTARPLLQNLVL